MGPPIVGAVLCGGRSSRFGSDKALVDVGGRPLAASIVDALRDAGADPVLAVGGTAGTELGVPTVDDRRPGDGPLAGLATSLLWVKRGLVIVAPCDLPLLTADHLRPLIGAATVDPATGTAAVAVVDGRAQPSLACWPAAWGPAILGLLDEGRRAWREALTIGPWTGVELPAEALADADTPADLAALLVKRAPSDESDHGP